MVTSRKYLVPTFNLLFFSCNTGDWSHGHHAELYLLLISVFWDKVSLRYPSRTQTWSPCLTLPECWTGRCAPPFPAKLFLLSCVHLPNDKFHQSQDHFFLLVPSIHTLKWHLPLDRSSRSNYWENEPLTWAFKRCHASYTLTHKNFPLILISTLILLFPLIMKIIATVWFWNTTLH